MAQQNNVDTSDRDMYIDVAIGKPASQSSLSEWSPPHYAGGVLTGELPTLFGIHTELEDAPWWQVDLLEAYPIDRIVLNNRRDRLVERARSICVEVSIDAVTWTTIHVGLVYFGSHGQRLGPLSIPLGGNVLARYVRLSLRERNILHLAQVQVFVSKEHLDLIQFWRQHNLNAKALLDVTNPLLSRVPYSVSLQTQPIVGLSIRAGGRFGNHLIQLFNAISVARRTGLKYIQVPSFAGMDVSVPRIVGGITFFEKPDHIDNSGAYLVGPFFRPFLIDFDSTEKEQILSEYIHPLFAHLRNTDDVKNNDELTVHIRAGDIFQTDPPPHPGYVQPPLVFYTSIIERMITAGTICRVRMVFEDRGNPVVDALENYLLSNKIPYRCQSGSFAADVGALVNARHLVFGVGTFGPAICCLSNQVESVHVFGDEQLYRRFASILNLFVLKLADAEYIKGGNWTCSLSQLELMLSCPGSTMSYDKII